MTLPFRGQIASLVNTDRILCGSGDVFDLLPLFTYLHQ